MSAEKPPIGVMPRWLFEKQRIKELSRAIYAYTDCCTSEEKLILEWAKELHERTQWLEENRFISDRVINE